MDEKSLFSIFNIKKSVSSTPTEKDIKEDNDGILQSSSRVVSSIL